MASLKRQLVAAWVMLTTPRRYRDDFYSFDGIVEFMVEHELSSLEMFRRYDFYFNCFADCYKDITGIRNDFVDPDLHSVAYMQAELKQAEAFYNGTGDMSDVIEE